MPTFLYQGSATTPRVTQRKRFTCGPAAMRAVLGCFGKIVEEAELERLTECEPGKGSTDEGLIGAAHRLGFVAYSHRFSSPEELRKLTRRGIPVICAVASWWRAGSFHWVVVEQVEDGAVVIMDPHPPAGKDNRRILTREAFDQRWWHVETWLIFRYRAPRLGVVIAPRGW